MWIGKENDETEQNSSFPFFPSLGVSSSYTGLFLGKNTGDLLLLYLSYEICRFGSEKPAGSLFVSLVVDVVIFCFSLLCTVGAGRFCSTREMERWGRRLLSGEDGADAGLPFVCGRVKRLVLFCVRCRIA